MTITIIGGADVLCAQGLHAPCGIAIDFHVGAFSDCNDEHFHHFMADAVDNAHPLFVYVYLATAREVEAVLVAKFFAELRGLGKFCNLLEDKMFDAPLKLVKFVRRLWVKEDFITHLLRFPRLQGYPQIECTRFRELTPVRRQSRRFRRTRTAPRLRQVARTRQSEAALPPFRCSVSRRLSAVSCRQGFSGRRKTAGRCSSRR